MRRSRVFRYALIGVTLALAGATASAQPGLEDTRRGERVGPPYQANGKWYVPTPEPDYNEMGRALRYDPRQYGQKLFSGETLTVTEMTAAHTTLPLDSLIKVRNLNNNQEITVRINDRGPFQDGAILTLSPAAAQAIGLGRTGGQVHATYVGPAVQNQRQAEAVRPAPPIQEVERNPAPPAPQHVAGLFIQAGAFASQANAERARQHLDAFGATEISPVEAGGRRLFRVRVAGFESPAAAQTALTQIRARGFSDAVLIQR